MGSPFPGMDPYLEWHWGDVHTRLIVYACDQLRGQLPEGLRVRAEEQVFVQADDTEDRAYYPDVRVVSEPPATYGQASGQSAAPVAEPLVVQMETEPATRRSIRIIDARSGNRVITAIEFLSMANKSDERGCRAYRQKQRDMIEAGVNFVEIDLIRGGHYVLAVREDRLPVTHLTTYRICVTRTARSGQAEVYPVPLQQRLPAIRIPLRATDADVHLDLQPLIDRSYENGGYEQDIDYSVEPVPPLSPSDAAWAHALLQEKGLR